MRGKLASRVVVLAMVLGLVAAACSNGGGGGTTSTTAKPHMGGQATFGAEQWPQCLNPITSCAYSSWTYYTVLYYIQPTPMMLDVDNNFVASPLLTEAPTTENGGIKQDPFTITYHINPKAVWADGTPITSEDFDFTWKAILNTQGTISTSGYVEIDSIDTSDPQTAVITFKDVYVDWPDVFGGAFQGLVEKAAFPDADPDKPDLSAEMTDSVPYSGGPWKLTEWDKSHAVLVRNDNYWGHKPYLDQVTFVRRQNQSTEINSILTGEVDAIFPQPSNVSLLDQFNKNPSVASVGGPSPYFEGLWLNNSVPPVNDPKVREALLYATDRVDVVNTIVKLNNPNATVLNCWGWAQGVGPYCDSKDFEQFTYQPSKSISILESDGYDCSDVPQGKPCTKDGKPLVIEYKSTAGNDRRADIEALLKQKAIPAGFQFDVKNVDPTILFNNDLVKGNYVMAEYASGGTPDPTVTSFRACDTIPTAANGYSGANTEQWCNKAATKLMYASDKEADPQKRTQEILKIGDYVAQDFVGVPLYMLPDVSAWRTDKLAGPIGDYNSHIYGLWWNMDQWYTVQSGG